MLLHYRLGERLGTGASGDVYLAEDMRLHRPVALKMLRADTAQDDEAAGRLLREARVASSLSHPNIAVVYEVGEVEQEGQKRGFIAMEHVRGYTLLERLREGPLPPPEALAVIRQVAEALQEAHDRGVVHRDVKPGNVMVTERGLVKVLDFGLAKFSPPCAEGAATWSGRHGALEGGGAILGTLAYMSPEQARGGDVDARSECTRWERSSTRCSRAGRPSGAATPSSCSRRFSATSRRRFPQGRPWARPWGSSRCFCSPRTGRVGPTACARS